jgi:NAD(P)H-dependent FMN reductase
MITVISGTNRPDSNTLKVSKAYIQLLEKQEVSCQLFCLTKLPRELAFTDLFNNRSTGFQQIIDKYILPSGKFVFISPEYNGSYPGILKTFLDALPPDLNRGKKAGLVGVSNGRAGNLRGMDHLTGVLHYLGMFVHPNKQPVSSVTTLISEDGKIRDELTLKILEKHTKDIIQW